MGDSVTTSLKLDPNTKSRVQRLAASRRRSAHWVLREAVDQYLAREEAAEARLQQLNAAWSDYRTTGLHATAEEVDEWLARLERGEAAPPPPCHD